MNCLNETEIQRYLDGEFPKHMLPEISEHLISCSICSELYEEAIESKNQVFSFLDEVSAFEQAIVIPEFLPKQYTIRLKLIVYWLSAAATILLFVVFGIHMKSQSIKQKQLENTAKATYEFTRNTDPNKMFHDKQIIVVMTNSSGEVVETSITE